MTLSMEFNQQAHDERGQICIGNLRFSPMGLHASKLQNQSNLKIHGNLNLSKSFIPIVSKNTLHYNTIAIIYN